MNISDPEFISWLNAISAISTAVLAVLTILLVTFTARYASLTKRSVLASEQMVNVTNQQLGVLREQLKAVSRPYISIRLLLGPTAFYFLEIKNIGRSTALNLRLEIDRDYEITALPPRSLAQTHLFSNGVSAFGPGNVVTFGLGDGSVLFGEKRDEEKRPPRFKITASYEFGNDKVCEENWIDLDQYQGIIQYESPIYNRLKKIDEKIGRIERHLGYSKEALSIIAASASAKDDTA